jgi:PAS domain S-box-containing protein
MEQLLFSGVSDDLVELAMQMIETSNDVIVISASKLVDSPEPLIIYANDAFVRESGYTKDEVIGQPSRILCGPKTNKATLKRIKHSIEQRYRAREKILNYKKNGDELWQVINIVPITNKAWQKTLFSAVQNNLKPQDLTRQAHSEFKYTLELISQANDLPFSD